MAFAHQREASSIAILLIANALFGISDKTTKFIFPAFGSEVFSIVNFYVGALLLAGLAFAITIIFKWINKEPLNLTPIPSIWAVIVNFLIFLIPSYLIISFAVQGHLNSIPIPTSKSIVEQMIVSADEGLLAFIFLTTSIPYGTGTGNMFPNFLWNTKQPEKGWNIIKIADYELNFNPPSWNRFKYGIYGIIIITLLHAGAYSFQVLTFNEFYISMAIAFILFGFLWFIKETFGFGACVSIHLAWNLVLISLMGRVM